MGKCRVLPVIVVVFFFAAVVCSALGMMSIQVKNGQVRATPSFLGSPVAPVAYGDQVEVLQQQGDWMEVNAPGGKKGWIHQSALTKKRIVFSSGGKDAQVSASGEEIALAGKGFNSDMEAKFKADNRGIDFSWVDRMEQMNISPQEMIAFLKEGGVKPQTGGVQ